MADNIRFLIASDIHTGYGELKKHIFNDSFDSFREVLKHGVENKVDFILLGGDLFHENIPSRDAQLKVVRLLREYCFRDGNVPIEFVSDPTINFQHSNFPMVNYEDPNINVSMPVFTIHGNHDDLSGKGHTALDLLHEAGLINLFGKFNDVDNIEVSPILLRKGTSKIAIYGISSQRDDRLCRAFMNGSVKFMRPDEDHDSWFNVLVVHQNRPRRSTLRTTGSFLPVTYIPTFIDLVIWGHEHESLIDPEYFESPHGDGSGFFIIQPGSTVATSLSREEAGKKHCAVVTVKDKQFKSKAIPLQTVRQVFVQELVLEDVPIRKMPRTTTVRQENMPDEAIIAQKIEEILAEAERTRGPKQPKLPLVRLKVVYSGDWLKIPPINSRKFGARYADRVANPTEMLSVRVVREKEKKEEMDDVDSKPKLDFESVDEMVTKQFADSDISGRMVVLNDGVMSQALREYSNVEGTTYTACDKSFLETVNAQIVKVCSRLEKEIPSDIEEEDEDRLDRQINKLLNNLMQTGNVKGGQETSMDF
ncbi:double-strand break repair protein mre-11 [Aphelenchoides avenae]|nr:double-strand break repair protein mre-11 [Aphelenchus avenae]